MTTRSQAGDKIHALVPDPQAMICAGNLKRRRQNQLEKLERHWQEALASRQARLDAQETPTGPSTTKTPPVLPSSSTSTPHQQPPDTTSMADLKPSRSDQRVRPHSVDTRNEKLLSTNNQQPPSATPTFETEHQHTEDCLRALMAAQLAAIQQAQLDRQNAMADAQAAAAQAQADRKASSHRIARIEEAIFLLSVRPTGADHQASPPLSHKPGHIDLQKF